MEIILLKDVDNLGPAGEIREVAAGYARNYLIPRGLATVVTKASLKQLELQRQAEARRQEKLEAEAREIATELEGLTLTFLAKAGEKDRLYGSITTGDIAGALERETGESVDRRKIDLEDPIRELGTYAVPVKLLPDVTPSVTVVVQKEEEPEHEGGRDDEEDRQELT
jgi:large subunit ribosomal protein L9